MKYDIILKDTKTILLLYKIQFNKVKSTKSNQQNQIKIKSLPLPNK